MIPIWESKIVLSSKRLSSVQDEFWAENEKLLFSLFLSTIWICSRAITFWRFIPKIVKLYLYTDLHTKKSSRSHKRQRTKYIVQDPFQMGFRGVLHALYSVLSSSVIHSNLVRHPPNTNWLALCLVFVCDQQMVDIHPAILFLSKLLITVYKLLHQY